MDRILLSLDVSRVHERCDEELTKPVQTLTEKFGLDVKKVVGVVGRGIGVGAAAVGFYKLK